MLAVDRDDLGPRPGAGPGHHRTGGDQRLLVGQREPLASLDRPQGDGQPGKAHHAVDTHVADRRAVSEGGRADEELGARSKAGGEIGKFRGRPLVGDDDHGGPELRGLRQHRLDRAIDAQRGNDESLRIGPNDIEGLGPDRTGRPHEAHGHPVAHRLARFARSHTKCFAR